MAKSSTLDFGLGLCHWACSR